MSGDVAKANVLALEKRISETGERVFNIGTGVPTSVNDIVKGLEKALLAKARARHGPAIKGEVRHIHLSIDMARKHLGFDPSVGLEEGLRRTVEWTKGREA